MPNFDPEFADFGGLPPAGGSSTPGASVGEIDLSTFDEAYKQAPVERPKGEEVPDGTYQVRVERAELTRAATTGNPMLKWGLVIVAGPHAKRWIWRNNVLKTAENAKFLKGDLYVCGVQLGSLNDLNKPEVRGQLIGVTLEVKKVTKAGVGGGDPMSNVYFNKRVVIAGGNEAPAAQGTFDSDCPF